MAEEVVGSVGVELLADDSRLKKQIPKMSNDVSNMFSSTMVKKGAIALGVIKVVESTIKGIGASIQRAIDVSESEDFFNRAMGNMADSTRAWSNKLQRELGLNAVELRKNTTTVFRMAEAMGVAGEQGRVMSQDLTLLAQDLASARNLRMEDAFNKITAALTGESEPMKRLGFVINETTVKQEALRTGMIKAGEEMTETQKVLARYSLIMRLTESEQGNFQDTMDMGANLFKRFDTQIERISQSIGALFLPAIEAVMRVMVSLTTAIADALQGFLEFIGLAEKQEEVENSANKNTKAQIKQADAINKVAKATKHGVAGFDELNQLQEKMNTLADETTDALTETKKEKPEVPDINADEITGEIEKLPSAFKVIEDSLNNTMKHLQQTWNGITRIFRGALKVIQGIIQADGAKIGEGLADVVLGLVDVIYNAFMTVVNFARTIIVTIGSTLAGIATLIGNTIANIVLVLIEEIQWMWNTFLQITGEVIKNLQTSLSKAWEKINSTAIWAFNKIKDGVLFIIRSMFVGIVNTLLKLNGSISKIWTGILETTVKIWDGIVKVIQGAVNVIIDAVNAVIGAWNKLKFTVPEINIAGQKFGGFTIGVPQIPEIGRLGETGINATPTQTIGAAAGGVAGLGGSIASAVGSALLQTNQLLNQGNNEREIVLNLDGREVARGIIGDLAREAGRIGNTTLINTVGAR